MISRGKVSDSLAIGIMVLHLYWKYEAVGEMFMTYPMLSILAVGMVLHLYWKYEVVGMFMILPCAVCVAG